MTAADESLLEGMFSADWLMAQYFPPIEYVVPGLIPEGLSLLVAAPKIGKSWLVLGLGVAAASGGYALGHQRVDRRPVLYLALEDGPRRLQSRLQSIGVTAPPSDLQFMTRTDTGLTVATIAEFVQTHADQKPLVILDTLGKVMPPAMVNETTYARDYRVTSKLKGIVDDAPGSSLIVVHHTRKAETGDFLDAVSGTNGIAGAADSVLVLRRDRQASEAVLHVTSRDAMEGSYGLTFDSSGVWSLNGATLKDAAQAAETTAQTAGVGDRMAEIIAWVGKQPEAVTASQVAEGLGLSHDDAGRYLRRAHENGRLDKPKRGFYAPVRSVRSVRNDEGRWFLPSETDTSDTTDTPPEGDEPEPCPRCGQPNNPERAALGYDCPACYHARAAAS